MPERTTLRVATYNIWMGGRGGAELDRAVRALDADVLLVNESPKTPLLWRRRCQRLADRWGRRFVVGGRPAGSNMILLRDGVVVVRASGSTRLRQPLFQPRRGIAWAQLRHRGRLFGVVCCHLSLDRERRLRETERILEVVGRLRGPVVLAGDLNEPPRGPAWQRLRAVGFVDHGSDDWPTFPAEAPTKRIDALLVRGAARSLRHGRPDGDDLDEMLLGRASDHRPILAELEIG